MKTIYSVPGVVLITALAACNATTVLPTSPEATPLVILSTGVPDVAITQGDHASVAIRVERAAGFTTPITVTVTGAPADAAIEVLGNPAVEDNVILRVAIGDATMPGSYPLNLSASGEGVPSQPPLPLELRVVQRAPVTIAVRYCTDLQPNWVAFQDGNGDWKQVQPQTAGGVFAYPNTFLTNRGAIATLVRAGPLTALAVRYGSPAELAAVGDTKPRDCGLPGPNRTLLGTLTGLEANEFGLVSGGFGLRARVAPDLGGGFTLLQVPAGPQDLLAARITRANGRDVVTGIIVRRDLDLPDGATLPLFDFQSTEAFAPEAGTLSITGAGLTGANAIVTLYTSHAELQVTDQTNPGTTLTQTYYGLPEARLLPGELQSLRVTPNPNAGGGGRSAIVYFRRAVDRTVAIGTPFIAPTFTAVGTGPALRPLARFADQPEYDRFTNIVYQQNTTLVAVSTTGTYDAITGGHDLIVPDLSSAPGFNPAWALRRGEPLVWNGTRLGGTLNFGRDAVLSDGATQMLATSAGTVDSPLATIADLHP